MDRTIQLAARDDSKRISKREHNSEIEGANFKKPRIPLAPIPCSSNPTASTILNVERDGVHEAKVSSVLHGLELNLTF